jgi:uncharacterized protein (DUF433 family)
MKTLSITPEMLDYGRRLETVPPDLKEVLWQEADRCSGAITVGDTRFPLDVLLNNLQDMDLETFFEHYPQALDLRVKIEQTLEYLADKTGSF